MRRCELEPSSNRDEQGTGAEPTPATNPRAMMTLEEEDPVQAMNRLAGEILGQIGRILGAGPRGQHQVK